MPLIVFEGVDGGGKTSQLKKVQQSLKHSGWNVSSGVFPTPLFRQWRSMLSDHNNPTNPLATAELVCLHILDFIRHTPASSPPDQILLLDRYYPSTAVYQSTSEIPSETILQMATSLGLPPPDLCILFVPPENDIINRLRPEDFHLLESGRWHEMRQEYLRIASADPSRWAIIDTSPSFEKVTSQLMTVIHDYLLSRGLHPASIQHCPSSQPANPSRINPPFRYSQPER